MKLLPPIFLACLLIQLLGQAQAVEWGQFNATVGLMVQKASGTSVCSGVLLKPRVVLTAAHCLAGMQAALVSASETLGTGSFWISAERWQIHPDYRGNRPGESVDLGLVYLASPLSGLNYPRRAAWDARLECERVGFGGREGRNVRTWQTSFPQERQGSSLRVQDAYGVQGDSGGPVYQQGSQGLRLIGIHTGREYGSGNSLRDVSFVQLLEADLWAWVEANAYAP